VESSIPLVEKYFPVSTGIQTLTKGNFDFLNGVKMKI
jgi:hypothetical protein